MKLPSLLLFSSLLCHAAIAAEPASSGLPLPQIDPANIVNSVTYDLGDRLLTVEQVNELALPTPPPMIVPVPTPHSPQVQAPQEAPMELVSMGATIYTGKTGPARTLVTYQVKGEAMIEFWSSADWRLLANLGSFQSEDGRNWQFLLLPSVIDIGEADERPSIPAFSGAEASFTIVQGEATPEQLVPIQSLHALYDRDHTSLLAAFTIREAARIQREAELNANPPVPKDIIIRSRMLTPEEIEATKAPQ